MIPLKFVPPRISLTLLLVFLGACGSAPRPVFTGLPANIMAHPRSMVAVVGKIPNASIHAALRALGIPYRHVPLAGVAREDLSGIQTLIIDEGALEEKEGAAAYYHLLESVEKQGTMLVLLQQNTETLGKITLRAPYKIYLRDVDYRLRLATPRSDDPVMRSPNTLTRTDLDSLGRYATQLAFGGEEARAIISANLDAPDSSAALLWEPYKRGAVWYLSVPVAAAAAAGHEAEQKLLANLLSNK